MSGYKNNNLEIFRNQINYFLNNSQQKQPNNDTLCILSYDQLKSLVNHLCDQKLLHPNQVKKIITKIQPAHLVEPQKPQRMDMSGSQISKSQQTNLQNEKQNIKKKIVSFPLSMKQFQNIIMIQFGDENCQNLLTDIKKFKTLLKQIKGVLNVWKDKGLTNQEKAQLESIFARGNEKILNLCKQLKNKKQILENISQQQIQMIKTLDEWIVMQKINKKFIDYQDYQKSNKQTINYLFNKLQVKEVHFKKNQANIKNMPQIYRLKGYNSKNDEPTDVVLIAKNSINFLKINKELIKFDALKQLSLSQYFPKFLGFNNHSSPINIQYFLQSIQSKNLLKLMKSQKSLTIQSLLIKYWIYQIYKAFYDLFLMCSYEPQLPIKLQHFQVRQYGLQIVLKNISFIQKRKKSYPTKIDPIQTKLLSNLGLVLLSLLNINPVFSQIDKTFSKLQQKSFFKGLLNTKQSHLNYQKGIVDNYLSFHNLQTHPLLQQSHFSEGVEIIEDYIAIFGNQ